MSYQLKLLKVVCCEGLDELNVIINVLPFIVKSVGATNPKHANMATSLQVVRFPTPNPSNCEQQVEQSFGHGGSLHISYVPPQLADGIVVVS